MRLTHHHPGRALAAVCTAGSLLLAAGPVAAGAVEPFDPRHRAAPSGRSAPADGRVAGCPTPPAEPPAHCTVPLSGQGPTEAAPGAERSAPVGRGGATAGTGSGGERLWLLGALAAALTAAGLVARAAVRGRRAPDRP
ncbi:hypothetical protein [Streptomyces sp. NPDC058872]|uniref:hypothetical protein n=1 Tax=Streptomyces sp. NPDC058872 TaxID=3346661 RepID=UPI0036C87BAE